MITLRGHHLKSLYDLLLVCNDEEHMENILVAVSSHWLKKGYSRNHILNGISIFKRALVTDGAILLTETLDDVCELCYRKGEAACRLSYPYETSTAKHDNEVLDFYGLLLGETYLAGFIHGILREKGKYKSSL